MGVTKTKGQVVKKKSVPIPIQNKFIMGLFRKGFVDKSLIREKFIKEYGTSEVTFNRRFAIVKKSWEKSIIAMEAKANAKVKEIESKIAEGQILKLIDRKTIAAKIARGEPSVRNGRLVYPNYQDQVRALEYISRIEGDYAPERHEFNHIHELLAQYTINDDHAIKSIPITSEKQALEMGEDIEFEEVETPKKKARTTKTKKVIPSRKKGSKVPMKKIAVPKKKT